MSVCGGVYWVPALASLGRDDGLCEFRCRRGTPRTQALEMDHDLAEDLAARKAREALLEICERDFRVDHGLHAGRHLGEAVGDVADGRAERADDAVLLLEQLHQVDGRRRAGGRAA